MKRCNFAKYGPICTKFGTGTYFVFLIMKMCQNVNGNYNYCISVCLCTVTTQQVITTTLVLSYRNCLFTTWHSTTVDMYSTSVGRCRSVPHTSLLQVTMPPPPSIRTMTPLSRACTYLRLLQDCYTVITSIYYSFIHRVNVSFLLNRTKSFTIWRSL